MLLLGASPLIAVAAAEPPSLCQELAAQVRQAAPAATESVLITGVATAQPEEPDRWEALIRSLTPEQLDEPRRQFNGDYEVGVRGFVCHMIQNCIYKHGQFATLFFALGLVVCAALLVTAPWAVRILLGKDYLPAIGVLRVAALVIPAVAVSNILGMQWMLPFGIP